MNAAALRGAAFAVAALVMHSALAQADDPRLREVVYDPRAVVTVPVKRGVVTHIVLAADEMLTDVGSGLGGPASWAGDRYGARPIGAEPMEGAARGATRL